ncbi:MAG: hypothetical protein MJ204_06385 [Bacteroidales bacterium]|nr:hypothetical protein [Bacteroidales bacterium]
MKRRHNKMDNFEEIDKGKILGILKDLINNAESKETRAVVLEAYNFLEKRDFENYDDFLQYIFGLQSESKELETKKSIDTIIKEFFAVDNDIDEEISDCEDLPF